MLPVYPLDGGKLLALILSKLLPYRKCLTFTILISYLMTTVLLCLSFKNIKISSICMFIFLFQKIYHEQDQINYIYEKFILERYLNDYKFKKSKLITSSKDFYRNNRHLIKENDKYYLEKEYLLKKYQKKQKNR